MFNKKIFGQRLHILRKEKKVTQTDIGNLLGITQTQVGDMERGNSATTMEIGRASCRDRVWTWV